MTEPIEVGFMAFLTDGKEGVGGVRSVSPSSIVIYVENAGEFTIPMTAVTSVHSQKVMLNPSLLGKDFLHAIRHVHDREDPNLTG